MRTTFRAIFKTVRQASLSSPPTGLDPTPLILLFHNSFDPKEVIYSTLYPLSHCREIWRQLLTIRPWSQCDIYRMGGWVGKETAM